MKLVAEAELNREDPVILIGRIKSLLSVTKRDWFKTYLRQDGLKYHFYSIRINADQLLLLIHNVTTCIMDSTTLPHTTQKDIKDEIYISLDSWLVDNNGNNVNILECWDLLVEQTECLLNSIDNISNEPLQKSTVRKLKYVFIDILRTMEALALTAFKSHERKKQH